MGAASATPEVRPHRCRRRHRRLGAGGRLMARAGKSVLLLEQSQVYEDKVRGRVDRALGRRRGPAGRPVRPADRRRRAPHHAPRHLRRDARAGGGRGVEPAAGHVRARRAGAAVSAPSGALPSPVRRRQGGGRDGAARRAGGRDRGRRASAGDLPVARPDHRGGRPAAGGRRRAHLAGARSRQDPPAPGQAAPLVLAACWWMGPRAGARMSRPSAPRAISASWSSRRAAAGCASTAAMRWNRTSASEARTVRAGSWTPSP